MGNAIKVLSNWFKEFIPALKVETMIIGFGLIAMSLCLAEVVWTSGLHGQLTYAVLTWGTVAPGIAVGALLVFLALTMKPVPRDQM